MDRPPQPAQRPPHDAPCRSHRDAVGIAVAIKPRYAAYIVAAWLAGIIVTCSATRAPRRRAPRLRAMLAAPTLAWLATSRPPRARRPAPSLGPNARADTQTREPGVPRLPVHPRHGHHTRKRHWSRPTRRRSRRASNRPARADTSLHAPSTGQPRSEPEAFGELAPAPLSSRVRSFPDTETAIPASHWVDKIDEARIRCQSNPCGSRGQLEGQPSPGRISAADSPAVVDDHPVAEPATATGRTSRLQGRGRAADGRRAPLQPNSCH